MRMTNPCSALAQYCLAKPTPIERYSLEANEENAIGASMVYTYSWNVLSETTTTMIIEAPAPTK